MASTAGSPRLFHRQRLLLGLVDALGGEIGNLDFQKLLFLYCQDVEDAPYDFVPYRFGAFSFTSYADRRKLIERGLLRQAKRHWALTDEGRGQVDRSTTGRLRRFARESAHLRGDDLVADTYRRFPYYATRSEVAERVLRDDAEALARIEEARPEPGPDRLFSIGYEGRSLEDYLNRLLGAGVSLLCDVRRNPLSRKYGFSKRALASGCEGIGIRYEHLPQLGIASAKRRNLQTDADYASLFAEYESETLPAQQAALERIASWTQDGERVALTCYERLPKHCHRHCVANALEARGPRPVRAMHL